MGLKRGPYKPQTATPRPRKAAKLAGHIQYFTGLPCKNGHVSNRWTCDGGCVDCAPQKRKRVSSEAKKKQNSRSVVWKSNNKELVKKQRQTYQLKHPDRKRASEHKRNCLKRSIGGVFTESDIKLLFDIQKGLCTICGCDLIESKYHIDHKIPLSRGGSNWPSNLQLLCPTDNLRKQALTDEEYRQKLGLIV